MDCSVTDGLGGAWYFWVDSLDPRLPNGPFVCPRCQHIADVEKVTGRKVKRVDVAEDSIGLGPAGIRTSYVFADTGEPIAPVPDVIKKAV